MPKKGSTAVKVTFMTMTLVTPVTAVKFDYGTVLYCTYIITHIHYIMNTDYSLILSTYVY